MSTVENLPLSDDGLEPYTGPEDSLEVKAGSGDHDLGDRLRKSVEAIENGYNHMRLYLGDDKFTDILWGARGGLKFATVATAVSLMVACSSGNAEMEKPAPPTPVVQPAPPINTLSITHQSDGPPPSSIVVNSIATVTPNAFEGDAEANPSSLESKNSGGNETEHLQEIRFNTPPGSENIAEGPVVIITEISGLDSVKFSLKNLTGGVDISLKGVLLDFKEKPSTYKLGIDLVKYLKEAGYSFSGQDEENIINSMRIDYGKTPRGAIIKVELLNSDFILSSEEGSFLYNPYKLLALHGLDFEPLQQVATASVEVNTATVTDIKDNTVNLEVSTGGGAGDLGDSAN